ncbi:MAG: hypothetical protein ACK5LN_10555 [Propioniciclava sp.]
MVSFRPALAAVGDAQSVVHGVVSTAALCGLTLVDPQRLNVGQRLGYRLALAGLIGWSTWAALASEDEFGFLSRGPRIGMTTGSMGAVLGLAEAGEALDAQLQGHLLRMGVPRPRVWGAVVGGVFWFGSWWLARRGVTQGRSAMQEESAVVPVPGRVAALVITLIEATDEYGAGELREQLRHARVIGRETSDDWTDIQFVVPDELPLAVPGTGQFPVRGRFRAQGSSRPVDLLLYLEDGCLAQLVITEAQAGREHESAGWAGLGFDISDLPGWPAAADVELLMEAPDGLQPLESVTRSP